MTINLIGLDKAEVLAALYNASRPLGTGFLHYDSKPMTKEEAAMFLEKTTYFDYLKGRVMKIDLSGDELAPGLYDRDNGEGAAWRVIETLRRTGETNPIVTQEIHRRGTLAAADRAKEGFVEKTTTKVEGETVVITLGLSDVASELSPAIDRAVESAKDDTQSRSKN